MRYILEDQITLITGGSQGLGKQFAQKYYQETINSKIIIVSRSENKLRKAVTDIILTATNRKKEEALLENDELTVHLLEDTRNDIDPIIINEHTLHSTIADHRLFYMPCDLSDYESVASLFQTLTMVNMLPTQVLSCAGGSTPKLFKDLSGYELESGVRMNYLTALYLSHQVAKIIPNCHLILFSSVTAFFPFIGYSQYAPLKVSLKALVGILRHELPHARISCVFPGNFQSEGFELEEISKPDITKTIEGPSYPISCEECCDKIVWWLEMGYDDITTDFIGWFLMSLDMGLNKHNNRSFLWICQLVIGTLANLIIVPIYMLICTLQIKLWHSRQSHEE